MYKKIKLDSGLRIITHRMPAAKSVALGVWIKTGGRHESCANKGIAHFLEHLIFKGSQKYSCRRIKEAIEGVGGSLNGFTSEELTCYLAKLPHSYLGLACDIISDMVAHQLLKKQEIEKERTVVLEEIKMYRDQPQSYVYDLLDALLWPGHPLGMSILGSAESISGVDRTRLGAFQAGHYTLSNMVVSVAGAFDPEWLAARASRLFPRLKKGQENVFLPVQERQVAPKLQILPKDTEQTHLALGFHGFHRDHRLKYAAGLLHVLLGANMSSRLFNEVREKRGLAYEIGTQLKRFQDTGAFLVHAGIDNRKVPQVISVILQELRKVRDNPVSKTEFKRARDFFLGQLMLALEDTLDHMLWIGESTAMLDRTYSWEDIIRDIKGIGRRDIQEAAKIIFQTKKINLALIGPLQDSENKIHQRLQI